MEYRTNKNNRKESRKDMIRKILEQALESERGKKIKFSKGGFETSSTERYIKYNKDYWSHLGNYRSRLEKGNILIEYINGNDKLELVKNYHDQLRLIDAYERREVPAVSVYFCDWGYNVEGDYRPLEYEKKVFYLNGIIPDHGLKFSHSMDVFLEDKNDYRFKVVKVLVKVTEVVNKGILGRKSESIVSKKVAYRLYSGNKFQFQATSEIINPKLLDIELYKKDDEIFFANQADKGLKEAQRLSLGMSSVFKDAKRI